MKSRTNPRKSDVNNCVSSSYRNGSLHGCVVTFYLFLPRSKRVGKLSHNIIWPVPGSLMPCNMIKVWPRNKFDPHSLSVNKTGLMGNTEYIFPHRSEMVSAINPQYIIGSPQRLKAFLKGNCSSVGYRHDTLGISLATSISVIGLTKSSIQRIG